MSATRDAAPVTSRHRHGVALLLALVTLVVVAVCLLATWNLRAGALRSDTLRASAMRRGTQADSLLSRGVDAVTAGAWRSLAFPGATVVIDDVTTTDAHLTATITRMGWHTLLVRGHAVGRTGVPAVQAAADQRLLIPLRAPLRLPHAAVTGGRAWTVLPAAAIEFAVATPSEVRCRDGAMPRPSQVDSMAVSLDAEQVTLLDPDTVSTPLTGVFRLVRDRIRRPVVIRGMVEAVTGLFVEADLQIVGVLVTQGSVQPAGGRLDVTGAVITRDSGDAGSVLGNGDRVRYDACAIRHAVERATRPAPAATWSPVGHP